MSKRAEQAALKAYPPMDKESHEIYLLRDGFINGYEQAEKDLALTVADIQKIADDVWYLRDVKGWEEQDVLDEVLRRFNEIKK